MTDSIKYPDEYIERMARFYTSEFVRKNVPSILEIPFIEWLDRHYQKRLERFYGKGA